MMKKLIFSFFALIFLLSVSAKQSYAFGNPLKYFEKRTKEEITKLLSWKNIFAFNYHREKGQRKRAINAASSSTSNSKFYQFLRGVRRTAHNNILLPTLNLMGSPSFDGNDNEGKENNSLISDYFIKPLASFGATLDEFTGENTAQEF